MVSYKGSTSYPVRTSKHQEEELVVEKMQRRMDQEGMSEGNIEKEGTAVVAMVMMTATGVDGETILRRLTRRNSRRYRGRRGS